MAEPEPGDGAEQSHEQGQEQSPEGLGQGQQTAPPSGRTLSWKAIIGLVVLFAAALLVADLVFRTGVPSPSYRRFAFSAKGMLYEVLLPHAALLALGLGAIATIGWWRTAGFGRPSLDRRARDALTVVAVLAVLAAIELFAGRASNRGGTYAVALLVTALVVGYDEEIWFRGIVLGGLLRTLDERRAIILAAALFSVSHLVNLAVGESLRGTAAQLVATFLTGLVFGWIRVRTGSIHAAALAHGLYDCFVLGYAARREELTDLVVAPRPGALAALAIVVLLIVAAIALARATSRATRATRPRRARWMPST